MDASLNKLIPTPKGIGACAALIAALLTVAPASAYVGYIDFERTNHRDKNSPPMPLGPANAKTWGNVVFYSGPNDGGVCVMHMTSSARLGTKVLAGVADGGAACDNTKPMRLRVNGAYLVGFYIIGKNPAGWRVTAFDFAKNKIAEKHALQGPNPNRTVHWVWVASTDAKIANVYVAPWDNSNPGTQFGLDGVTIGQGGLSGSEEVEDE